MSYRHIKLIFPVLVAWLTALPASSQQPASADSLAKSGVDSMAVAAAGSLTTAAADTADLSPDDVALETMLADSTAVRKRHKRDWSSWKPQPKRALWLALVLPGAGQIYNRKYWKLPIIYGGFVGCAYALRWNGMMYHDYSQAYLDIMDSDPTTQSYNQFLHLGTRITDQNIDRWKEVFRKRKDRYRRWRDLSFFAMVGVYALSVIDAYVDASLSEFDISKDLSLRVAPAVISPQERRNPIKSSGLGLQCMVNF